MSASHTLRQAQHIRFGLGCRPQASSWRERCYAISVSAEKMLTKSTQVQVTRGAGFSSIPKGRNRESKSNYFLAAH